MQYLRNTWHVFAKNKGACKRGVLKGEDDPAEYEEKVDRLNEILKD